LPNRLGRGRSTQSKGSIVPKTSVPANRNQD